MAASAQDTAELLGRVPVFEDLGPDEITHVAARDVTSAARYTGTRAHRVEDPRLLVVSVTAFLRDHPVDSKRIEDIRHWLPEAKAQMRGSAGSLTR